MSPAWIRWLFAIGGIYDLTLGAAFLVAAPRIFESFHVTPPNHYGYVQFPAILLLVFGAMFLRIAANPRTGRELILYGAGLKVAYCVTVFGHRLAGGMPDLWMPWAWADLLFLVAFLAAWTSLGRPAQPAAGQ